MTAPASPTTAWTLRGVARALAIGCFAIGVGACVGYSLSHEPVPQSSPGPSVTPRPRPAGDAELALLAPLREGGPLGGFTVTEIDAVDEHGLLRLVARRELGIVKLDVALRDHGGPPPPATAGKYAVYYAVEGASPADGDALARALASVLDTHATVPAPPHLATFAPGRR